MVSNYFTFTLQSYFQDPEGQISLPSTFEVKTWKRPSEFIAEQVTFRHFKNEPVWLLL